MGGLSSKCRQSCPCRLACPPDPKPESQSLVMKPLGAVWRHIRSRAAPISEGAPQDTAKPQPDGQIQPDQGIGPRQPFCIGCRMAAFKDPTIPADNVPDQRRFLVRWPRRPAGHPVNMIHVIDRQVQSRAHQPGERAFAGSRAACNHHASHRVVLADFARSEKPCTLRCAQPAPLLAQKYPGGAAPAAGAKPLRQA